MNQGAKTFQLNALAWKKLRLNLLFKFSTLRDTEAERVSRYLLFEERVLSSSTFPFFSLRQRLDEKQTWHRLNWLDWNKHRSRFFILKAPSFVHECEKAASVNKFFLFLSYRSCCVQRLHAPCASSADGWQKKDPVTTEINQNTAKHLTST